MGPPIDDSSVDLTPPEEQQDAELSLIQAKVADVRAKSNFTPRFDDLSRRIAALEGEAGIRA